jgi:cobalt-zinc-cadmium efflux system protein
VPAHDDPPGDGHEHTHAGHSHAHGHAGHHHNHTSGLKGALVLTGLFLIAEVVGGLASNSLTLLADAGHMLTDVGALAFSLFVAWLSRQPSNSRKTYGYLRWEILAAFLNGVTLLGISVAIIWEAISRIRTPEHVETGIALVVAVAGLFVNTFAARLLHSGAEHSLNVRGAYLHVLSDLLGSVAAVVAMLLVRLKGWTIADPIASIVMTALIVRGSWSLIKESVDVLLEAVPSHIDLTEVRAALEGLADVESVHDLHVWTLTSGVVAMSAHAIVHDPARHQGVLEEMNRAVGALGVHHVTIQLEGRTLAECVPETVHA